MDLALSLFGNHSTDGYISGKDIASVSLFIFFFNQIKFELELISFILVFECF